MTSAEALLDGLGNGLGPWSYAVVGVLAFLETSANFTLPGQEATVQATYDLDGRALAIFIAR